MVRRVLGLLLALCLAVGAVPAVAAIDVQAADGTTGSGYKYAVQLWGIMVDEVEDGSVGGLTFGPAMGANYVSDYQSCSKAGADTTGSTDNGNSYRCIHDDDWATIIEWSDKDPYVYEKCLENRCTSSITLTMTDDNSASGTNTAKVFNKSTAKSVTGDGTGEIYDELQGDARKWADVYTDTAGLNWANSRVRAMLNGLNYTNTYVTSNSYSENNSLLSAFPSELRDAIAKKKVSYAATYTDFYTGGLYADTAKTEIADALSCYDALWLPSNAELYGGEASKYTAQIPSILDESQWENYPQEGDQYEWTNGVRAGYMQNNKLKAFCSAGSAKMYWTRTMNGKTRSSMYVSLVSNSGGLSGGNPASTAPAIAPCFVLPTTYVPKTESDGSNGSGHHCHHVYEWETYAQATSTSDGIMRYRCKYCGDVQYEVPVTAYYMFNKNTQEAILKAEQGATVTTETALFISFHDMVQKALAERPDVTLVVDYRNAVKNYEMTIPAGSAEQLGALFGDSQFAGFLYLGGTYATTELPEDWTFSTVPASVVWFGTTNAH